LTRAQRRLVSERVRSIFSRARDRLLGRPGVDSPVGIRFSVDGRQPEGGSTLADAMRYASALANRGVPVVDPNDVDKVAEIFSNYMDAEAARSVNSVIQAMEAAATPEQASRSLVSALNASRQKVETILMTETRQAQAHAERDGIARVAADLGDPDPDVCWVGPLDAKTCKWCLAMYHDSRNPHVPRIWRLSQLRGGYFKPKEWDGESVYQSAHPRCRHVMTIIPKGYSFDAQGKLRYIGKPKPS
jgi:hypothetical protein